MLIAILSTQLPGMAQNTAMKANSNSEASNMIVASDNKVPLTLKELNQEFIIRAKMRIADNEKSVFVMKATQNIQNKEELIYYKEKVLLFENRNMEMNNKMYAFNVVSGTMPQFLEFKKRWHWAMDELSVYQKNLMTENFLNK